MYNWSSKYLTLKSKIQLNEARLWAIHWYTEHVDLSSQDGDSASSLELNPICKWTCLETMTFQSDFSHMIMKFSSQFHVDKSKIPELIWDDIVHCNTYRHCTQRTARANVQLVKGVQWKIVWDKVRYAVGGYRWFLALDRVLTNIVTTGSHHFSW